MGLRESVVNGSMIARQLPGREPRVLNMHHMAGGGRVLPNTAKYVGRPSVWRNHFTHDVSLYENALSRAQLVARRDFAQRASAASGFAVSAANVHVDPASLDCGLVLVDSRDEAVECYRAWVMYYDADDESGERARDLRRRLWEEEELRGWDLVCYCAPKRCHADVLLELANL